LSYPNFNLEDKVVVEGEGNVTMPINMRVLHYGDSAAKDSVTNTGSQGIRKSRRKKIIISSMSSYVK